MPRFVDTLCRDGLLTRTTESPQQGGRVQVTVTDQGRRQVEAIHREMEFRADAQLRGLVELLHAECGLMLEPSDVDMPHFGGHESGT